MTGYLVDQQKGKLDVRNSGVEARQAMLQIVDSFDRHRKAIAN